MTEIVMSSRFDPAAWLEKGVGLAFPFLVALVVAGAVLGLMIKRA